MKLTLFIHSSCKKSHHLSLLLKNSLFEKPCPSYDLPARNKKAEISPLTTALIAHLRSQFNHVFALLISMACFCFKALIFTKIGLKFSYFCKNIANIPNADPQITTPKENFWLFAWSKSQSKLKLNRSFRRQGGVPTRKLDHFPGDPHGYSLPSLTPAYWPSVFSDVAALSNSNIQRTVFNQILLKTETNRQQNII